MCLFRRPVGNEPKPHAYGRNIVVQQQATLFRPNMMRPFA